MMSCTRDGSLRAACSVQQSAMLSDAGQPDTTWGKGEWVKCGTDQGVTVNALVKVAGAAELEGGGNGDLLNDIARLLACDRVELVERGAHGALAGRLGASAGCENGSVHQVGELVVGQLI